jgi:hypothetical protein
MTLRSLLCAAAAAVAVAAACAAPAAHAATIAPDPTASEVTALDGAVVWVSGAAGAQRLMQRDASGTRSVPGAPVARAYRSIDLGHDRAGGLVLTYVRCPASGACAVRRDDVRGHRASVRGLTLTRCSLSTAPAVWRTNVAYGLLCRKRDGRTFDAARSGLYVKADGRSPRRLPLPRDAVRTGATSITHVDLRGTRVAAVAADVYAYGFVETTAGRDLWSFRAATSEGDGDERVGAIALGTTATLWTLTQSSHAGDPNAARISRLQGTCQTWETIAKAPGPDEADGYPATALAADGATLYLVVPGTGVVTHDFTPVCPTCPA